MGNSPSREEQHESGENVESLNHDRPESSSTAFQRTESPTPRVKRKRENSSREERGRKKRKRSPPPSSTPANQSTTAPQDGTKEEDFSHPQTTAVPSKASTGRLPQSHKMRMRRQAKAVQPAGASESQEMDSVYREPESSSSSDLDGRDWRLSKTTQSGVVCDICRRHFAARKHLSRHLANPRVHEKKYKCAGCVDTFYQVGELKVHLNDTGHTRCLPQSRRAHGTFTKEEKAKVNRFKRRFCNDNSLSEFDFNTLMTLLGRRDGSEWPNPDVTRAEFRDLFNNVLPDRSTKSMSRYRERYFQNVEQDTEWTEEQISELRDLVNDKGHKWVEIGRRLGRTQDSVYQKWKNRIRQGDAQRFERWEEGERKALIVAVQDCKKAAGVAPDFSSDDKVNWTAVSDRLGRRRNAQQCSSFWKRVYRPREEAKARGEDMRPLGRGRSKPESTISRRHFRRRVTRGGESVKLVTPQRKVRSATYVTESDEDGQTSSQVTRSSEDKKCPKSEPKYLTSQETNDSEQDAGGTEDSGTTEQPSSDEGDDAHKEDGDNFKDDSPTRKPQRPRSTNLKTALSAAVRHSPELPPTPQQTIGSFQAVNGPQHGDAASLRRNGTDATPQKMSVAGPSPPAHHTPSSPQLSKRTPQQVMSLTQIFHDTQGPTSARTAGSITSGVRSMEGRPSPDTEIRLRPLPQSSLVLKDDGEKEDPNEQDEAPEPATPEFTVYESEAESLSDGQSDHKFSSTALQPITNEVDLEAHRLNDKQPPQMFRSAPLRKTDTSAGTDSDSADTGDETSLRVFDHSETLATSQDKHTTDLEAEGDDERRQLFGRAPIPAEPSEPSETESSGAEEDEETEAEADNDDEALQMFTSALSEQEGDSPEAAQNMNSPRARLTKLSSHSHKSARDQNTSSSSSPTSSSDAHTVLPNEPSDSESEDEASGTGSDEDSGGDSSDGDESTVEVAQGDFFANLEASAKKVRMQRANLGARTSNGHVNMQVQGQGHRKRQGQSATTSTTASGSNGAKPKRKLVHDVSSDSGSVDS